MAEAKETKKEELVEIELHVPFMTNGKLLHGKVKVTPGVAEDLKRRMAEYDADKRKLLSDNGENIDALKGETLKG